MQMNTILRLGLEKRVAEMLHAKMNETQIAAMLTKESGTRILQQTVSRYLKSNDRMIVQAVHENDELKTLVISSEIDEVKERKYILDKIHRLSDMAEARGDYKTALMSCTPNTQVLDGLIRSNQKYRDHDTQLNLAIQVNQESDKKFDQFVHVIMSSNDNELKEKVSNILLELVPK